MKLIIALILTISIFSCESLSGKKVPIAEQFKGKNWAFSIPHLNDLINKKGGTIGITAKACSQCHKKIYEEWKMSTHASAYQDLQFQAEISKKDSPKWLCLNCHTPVQNQRKYIITHLENGEITKPIKNVNPNFNKEMREESITCATCHIRSDDQGRSYVIGPDGRNNTPHTVKKDPDFLKNRCDACHNVHDRVTPNLICWFKTGEELRNGPYYKQECINCHMPTEKRPLVVGGKVREVSRHYWVGGGVPKTFADYDTLIKRGYGGLYEPSLDVNVSLSVIQDKASVKVSYKNARAGHWLPTGDPECFILLKAILVDSESKNIYEKALRIGQKWEWKPIPKQLSDNRLKPKEERVWDFTIPLPNSVEGLKLIVTAMHVRLTKENILHMKKSTGVDKVFAEKVKNLEKHYPFASYIYKEEINLREDKRRIYNIKELIELSKKKKGHIPLY